MVNPSHLPLVDPLPQAFPSSPGSSSAGASRTPRPRATRGASGVSRRQVGVLGFCHKCVSLHPIHPPAPVYSPNGRVVPMPAVAPTRPARPSRPPPPRRRGQAGGGRGLDPDRTPPSAAVLRDRHRLRRLCARQSPGPLLCTACNVAKWWRWLPLLQQLWIWSYVWSLDGCDWGCIFFCFLGFPNKFFFPSYHVFYGKCSSRRRPGGAPNLTPGRPGDLGVAEGVGPPSRVPSNLTPTYSVTLTLSFSITKDPFSGCYSEKEGASKCG